MAREGDLYPGIREPIWYGDRKVYTVAGFILGIADVIKRIQSMWVLGEVSNFKYQPHLSMVYFTVKDLENGYELECVMGRSRFEQLGISIQDGDRVQVFGRPDIYPNKGRFSLRVSTMEHEGRGLIMQQLEALKAKLAAEGLLADERKRPIPLLPRRVGLVTGRDAAAQGDFLRNVTERFPPVQIAMIETLVQGDRAAPQVAAAIRRLGREPGVDVIVVTRGGGAFEDFLPFSDERVCRAIAESPVPVVSAIGHEKDNPLSDHVADLRVSTPTAAARTVVPDHSELTRRLATYASAMRRRTTERARHRVQTINHLRARLEARSPARIVRDRIAYVAQLRARSRASISRGMDLRQDRLVNSLRGRRLLRQRLEHTSLTLGRDLQALRRGVRARVASTDQAVRMQRHRLNGLSPQRVLDRGYAIVRAESETGFQIVGRVAQLELAQNVTIQFADGTARAHVAHLDEENGRDIT